MSEPCFTGQTFDFLTALAANNTREWFDAHRQDYEDFVRTPALDFIDAIAQDMPAISPHFRASTSKIGGSLMRIQRNLRFSRDKTPYKTNIGIQFRHELGKDVHAPGYYLHIEPQQCFVGVGLWRPEPAILAKIRDAIVEHGEDWLAARDDKAFRKYFELKGNTLTNAPRGYAKDHPLVEDLKRKDFIGMAELGKTAVISRDFRSQVVEHFCLAKPYMRFLCNALGVRF